VGGRAGTAVGALDGAFDATFDEPDDDLGTVEDFPGLEGASTGLFEALRRGIGPHGGRISCMAGFATPGIVIPGLPWSSSTVLTDT
jgi:hypothetical protein